MALDTYDFEPLFPEETEAAIRARWNEWANEGLTPDQVDQWTDTREGSFFQVVTEPGVRESARSYQRMDEVVAAAHPLWAWESYLDDHAEVQDVQRLPAEYASGVVTFSGPVGTVIPSGTPVGVEPPTPDADAPEYEVTVGGVVGAGGTVDLPIRATEPGSAGNVAPLAITALLSQDAGLAGVSVVNADQTIGGEDTETDEALRERLLEVYGGEPGGWNVRLYKIVSRAYSAAIGRVTVVPLWDGPNTVKVIITDRAGQPLPAELVTGLQNFLDPVAGKGHGQVTIGAQVTVETAAALNIVVAGTVEFEAGYSWDGYGGTVALGDAITDAVEAYVESVESGGEVVIKQVEGRVTSIPGVHDLSGLTLNGAAVNVPVPANPARVPVLVKPLDLVEGEV
ncbi:MAG TPA: baseplate J/gp47 family protein [Longimicrobiales bacterium]